MTWELVINFSMNQIQLMFYHYSKWLKTATENRTILKILQVTANITTQETKIEWVPNFEQQISHHFPTFFSQKKVDDFSQKKMVEKLQLRRQRLRAEATSPRSHFCLAAWERPTELAVAAMAMAHLWPIYGTPLVSEVGAEAPTKNSGDVTVCELENGVLDCKT
jgi:hypothetical protein